MRNKLNATVIDGELVRRLRISKNLSRRKLAEILGVHFNVISNVENEIQNMELSSFRRLANVLGTTTDALFKPETKTCVMN